MRQIALLLTNTLTLIFALILNGLAGSGVFNGKTVGEISGKYDTLIAPSGYAFAIWGIIYLLLILFVGYQWYAWFRQKEDRELKQAGLWFALGNIANGLWIVAWLSEYMGLSVILIFTLLLSLIMLTFRLRLEIWDAPMRIIAFVWWPIVIYLGWIVVASVANVSTYLVSIDWQGGAFSPQTWTIIMIGVATILYLLLIITRNMREAALVGVWAFVAIAVKHSAGIENIMYAAIIASIILFVAVSIHGYKNRETSPLKKIQRGEI